MTAIAICPYCQGEYASYENTLEEDGQTYKVHKGKCPNCNITITEIPNELAEPNLQRLMREREIFKEANSMSLNSFLKSHNLSEYPMFEVADLTGRVHTAFTFDEAMHVGYALFPKHQAFRIVRGNTTVKVVIVPEGSCRMKLRVDYTIPDGPNTTDGEDVSFTFGCKDIDEVDRLIEINRPRGLFFQSQVY